VGTWKSLKGDTAVQVVMRIVALTIEFQQPQKVYGESRMTVGGDIDVVKITINGNPTWVQHKQNCEIH